MANAFTLELSASSALNWSILLASHIFDAKVILQQTEQIRPVLVDVEKCLRYTRIKDIVTILFDSYYRRAGKLELTRDRKWDNIPKCYYLGFKKSGKKLVFINNALMSNARIGV